MILDLVSFRFIVQTKSTAKNSGFESSVQRRQCPNNSTGGMIGVSTGLLIIVAEQHAMQLDLYLESNVLRVSYFRNVFVVSLFPPKSNKNILRIFALKVFIAFLGLTGSFLGLPVHCLINDISSKVPRKTQASKTGPQEATKNFRAEILQYFCCYFGQPKDISTSLTVLIYISTAS